MPPDGAQILMGRQNSNHNTKQYVHSVRFANSAMKGTKQAKSIEKVVGQEGGDRERPH